MCRRICSARAAAPPVNRKAPQPLPSHLPDGSVAMRVWLVVLLLLCGWGGYSWWRHRPVHDAPGILADAAPDQENLPHGTQMTRGHFSLEPRASFAMTARVLSREDYQLDDLAPIAPTDLAMGWGRMSDSKVLDR